MPVKDLERFKEHMQEEHNITKDHIVLMAQHFMDAKENEEIIERVEEEMFRYLDNTDPVAIKINKMSRKVVMLHRCPFCKEASDKRDFRRHLNLAHNIFFGHEILVASKLLTIREKDHLIKRVQNKATCKENDQTIWQSEKVICNFCQKMFKSNERLTLHVKNQQCSDCSKTFPLPLLSQ